MTARMLKVVILIKIISVSMAMKVTIILALVIIQAYGDITAGNENRGNDYNGNYITNGTHNSEDNDEMILMNMLKIFVENS